MKTPQTLTRLFIIFISYSTSAQISFERILPLPPSPQFVASVTGIENGAVCFADVDADGDNDLIIAGDESDSRIAQLYINDGSSFLLQNDTPFEPSVNGSIATADIDGDNDLDVVMTGTSVAGQTFSKLYLNDGSGNFSVAAAPFDGVEHSSIAFSDIDGDGDEDLMITGRVNVSTRISKLYSNDGNGGFAEVTGTPFEAVAFSSIAFSDVESDGDMDLVIAGQNSSFEPVAKLYLNDGTGSFVEDENDSFAGVSTGAIGFSDVDRDGDEDLLITGASSSGIISQLYLNDGAGIFSIKADANVSPINGSSIDFSDINGDNYPDLITGGYLGGAVTRMYTNDGTGIFTEVTDAGIDDVSNCFLSFADINTDGSDDLLVTGRNSSSQIITELYFNDGLGVFSASYNSVFDITEDFLDGSIAFSDIDGDNDQDLFISGFSNGEEGHVFVNDGDGNYTQSANGLFEGSRDGKSLFFDLDGDGDDDLLVVGENGSDEIGLADLYENNGMGAFSKVEGTPFTGVWKGSAAAADIDNDGDQDLLILGESDEFDPSTKLYLNDGNGGFTEVIETPFPALEVGAVTFTDVDGDNDVDVLLVGDTGASRIAGLYLNDGSGVFSEAVGTPFEGVNSGPTISHADVDLDGDEDVLITGWTGEASAKLYLNDGNGQFSISDNEFEGVYRGAVSFADLENDGDDDLVIAGFGSSGRIMNFYLNDGSGVFQPADISLEHITGGEMIFEDIDGDSDLDLLISGSDVNFVQTIQLFRNTTPTDNIAPVVTIDPLVTSSGSPAITGTVDDPSATLTLTVQSVDYTPVNNLDGTWTLAQGSITPALPEGVHELVIKAMDASGNIGFDDSVLELEIDQTAPMVSINSLITNEVCPEISGNVNDQNATVVVEIDGKSYHATIESGDVWFLAAGSITPALAEGQYDLTVYATDPVGNVGQDETSNELIIDLTSPVITIHPLTTSNLSPQITGSIDDPEADITLTIDGNDYAVLNENGNWLLEEGTINPELKEATYDIIVAATDEASNSGVDTSTDELVIDVTPPVITVHELTSNDGSPAITGAIDDPQATIEVEVNNRGAYTATNVGDGTWLLPQGTIDPPLAEGSYDVVAIATDGAGLIGIDPSIDELVIDFSSGETTLGIDKSTYVLVYPNPSSHYLTIQPEEAIGLSEAALVNMNGTTVWQKSLVYHSGDLTIDVSELAEGFYTLRINKEGHSDVEQHTVIIRR